MTKKEKAAMPAGYKRCRKCGQILPLEDFPVDAKVSDGRSSYCRDCYNVYQRERAHIRKANAEAGFVPPVRRGVDLKDFSDIVLYRELLRRGYRGELTRITSETLCEDSKRALNPERRTVIEDQEERKPKIPQGPESFSSMPGYEIGPDDPWPRGINPALVTEEPQHKRGRKPKIDKLSDDEIVVLDL